MDQGPLVEKQVADGARIVEKLRESGFDVAAAWWMKTCDDGLWFLHIASKEVDEKGIRAAYGAIDIAMHALEPLWVDRFEVKVVAPDDPVAKAVLEILTRYPGRLPTRYGTRRLGNVTVDDAYIYPAVVAA